MSSRLDIADSNDRPGTGGMGHPSRDHGAPIRYVIAGRLGVSASPTASGSSIWPGRRVRLP